MALDEFRAAAVAPGEELFALHGAGEAYWTNTQSVARIGCMVMISLQLSSSLLGFTTSVCSIFVLFLLRFRCDRPPLPILFLCNELLCWTSTKIKKLCFLLFSIFVEPPATWFIAAFERVLRPAMIFFSFSVLYECASFV